MTTVYINADYGNDNDGNGTQSLPFKTISKAFQESKLHDIIYCFNSKNKYEFTDQTISFRTLEGQSTTGVIFDGGGKNANWIIGANGNDLVTINNITFQNICLTENQPALGLVASGYTFNLNNCIFHDIKVFDGGKSFTSGVIGHRDNTSSLTINMSKCLFYKISKNDSSTDGYIFAMRVNNDGSKVVSINLTNCTIYQASEGKHKISYLFGIKDDNVDSKSNISVKLLNCIIKNASKDPLSLCVYPFKEDSYIVSYSDLFNLGDWKIGEGSIYEDPMFVDEEGGNFNLRPGSPCKDGGKLL